MRLRPSTPYPISIAKTTAARERFHPIWSSRIRCSGSHSGQTASVSDAESCSPTAVEAGRRRRFTSDPTQIITKELIPESNPLSEEIVERASKNVDLRANNAYRYENAQNIARPQIVNPSFLRPPTGQQYKQQWQNYNNGNYRPYNQFKAHQPEKTNYRNDFNNKNWHSNQPIRVAAAPQVPPALAVLDSAYENKLLTSAAETFISSPSVLNQRERTNNGEYRPVKPQYYQGPRVDQQAPAYQKPAVQGLTQLQYNVPTNNKPINPKVQGLTQPQYNVPTNNKPINPADQGFTQYNIPTSNKPIEIIITEKQPVEIIIQDGANNNLPTNVQSLKNENAVNANKNHRGFTIVHSNGTIEHVDEITAIHKTNPNYFIMNAGDFVPNKNNLGALSPLPIDRKTNPSPLIAPNPIPLSQVPYPTNPLWYPQWNNAYYKSNNRPVAGQNEAINIPPPNKFWPAYKPLNFSSSPAIPALPPQNQNKNPMPNVAIAQSPAPKVNEVSESKIDVNPPTLLAVVSEDASVVSPPDDSVTASPTTVVPSPITIAPTAPSDETSSPPDDIINQSDDALTTVPPPTTQYSVAPDVTPAVTPDITIDVTPSVTSDVAPDVTTDSTYPALDQLWNFFKPLTTSESDQFTITTPGAEGSESTTPTPIVNIPVTNTSTTDSSIWNSLFPIATSESDQVPIATPGAEISDPTTPTPIVKTPVTTTTTTDSSIWNVFFPIQTSESDQVSITPPGAEGSDSTTPTPIVNIPVTTTSTTDSSIWNFLFSSATSESDTDSSISLDDNTTPEDDDDDNNDGGDTIVTISPKELPINDLSNKSDGTVDIATTAISDNSETDAKATILETSAPVNDDIIVNAPSTPARNEVAAEIDMSNLKTANPAAWFKASKSEFWEKLTKGDDYDVIYFLQMHPQPIIQKDSKTTIFCNGTIYEEITETKWDGKGDTEPKTTKTIKITHQ